MHAIPLCRASALLPFLRFLNQIGSPTEQLLQQSGLPIFALDDPEALIPFHQACLFIAEAAQHEGIDNLGILVGQQTQISDLGRFGRLLCQCLTLEELLSTVEQMIHTYSSSNQMWMVQEGDRMGFHHQCQCPPTFASQQIELYVVALIFRAFRLFLGPDWQPIAIHLQGIPSQKLVSNTLFSNTPVVFMQPSNAIIFPRTLLSTSRRISPLSCRSDHQNDYQFLQLSAPSSDFDESLKQLLRSLISDGYPHIEQVAELTGISPRSLQRHLSKSGLSYSNLVDQVRFEASVHLLKDRSIKLIEVSTALGYSDAGNFTRAFRRWAGVSPRQFRYQCG
ncbi:MAG TPA: AraC family transcriptional regulator ligand-binding domain-containing protein [Chroococcidiopsis sp.]